MRRADKQIAIDQTIEILQTGEYGVLSLIDEAFGSYGVPLSYVFFNKAIYFHCAHEGHKIDCLKANNHVSFCVIGKTELVPQKFSTRYESVILTGQAFFVEGQEKMQALLKLVEKYAGAFMEQGQEYAARDIHKTSVVRIDVQTISGKRGKG